MKKVFILKASDGQFFVVDSIYFTTCQENATRFVSRIAARAVAKALTHALPSDPIKVVSVKA